MVKHYLTMTNASTMRDQIWFKLSKFPDDKFSDVCIAPTDSPYYSLQSVSDIQAQVRSNPDDQFVLFGDMNARIPDSQFNNPDCDLAYCANPDLGTSKNGRDITSSAEGNNLIPLNHEITPRFSSQTGVTGLSFHIPVVLDPSITRT